MNGMATCDGMQCGFMCYVMQCGMACTNPMTDPKNCGACGHDCLGGQCNSGLCQPITIISNLPNPPTDIAVDTNNVYWTENASTLVVQATLLGGIPTVITNNAANPSFIAVDATNVYYVDQNGLYKAPIGSTNNVTNLVGSANRPGQFHIDATTAYYVNYMTYWLDSVPLAGGPTTPLYNWGGCLGGFALDANNAYWTKFDCSSMTTLYQQPRNADAGAPIALTSPVPGSGPDVQVDATTVYFSTGAAIYSVPIGGGKTTMLSASGGPNIVVDGNFVYWGDLGAHKVSKVPKTGGAAIVLAYDPQQQPEYVATDSQFVYWGDVGAVPGIYKAPK